VDRTAGELAFGVRLTGREDTKLAGNIADLGKATSVFGGALGSDAAMSFLMHWALPDALRDSLSPVVDEAVKKALENEKDDTRRSQAEKFFKALDPTLKAGDVDVAFSLRGPSADKHYTLMAGVKLKDGAGVEKAVRDLVKSLPERDQEKVKFDAETADGVKIHRVDAHKSFDAKARQTLGDHPLYVAFKDDALVVGGGPDGLAALKEALTAAPKAGPQFQFTMALARAAELMAQDKQNTAAPAAARKVFGGGGKGDDTISLVVEGGKELKVRFSAKALVVKFFAELDRQRKGKSDDSN